MFLNLLCYPSCATTALRKCGGPEFPCISESLAPLYSMAKDENECLSDTHHNFFLGLLTLLCQDSRRGGQETVCERYRVGLSKLPQAEIKPSSPAYRYGALAVWATTKASQLIFNHIPYLRDSPWGTYCIWTVWGTVPWPLFNWNVKPHLWQVVLLTAIQRDIMAQVCDKILVVQMDTNMSGWLKGYLYYSGPNCPLGTC